MGEKNPEKLSSAEKRDILAELEDEHRDMRQNQREIRRRWIKTQSAVEGRQLMRQGGSSLEGSLGLGHEEAGAASSTENVDDEHIIFNDLRRVYNTDMQRLTSYFLRPEVIPDNKSVEMKEGSRVGRIFLADHIRKTGAEQLKQGIARSLILRNIAILKVGFDPHAGRMVRKPRFSLFGYELGNKWEREGDMFWDLVNPKCILLPKFCRRVEDADKVEEYHVESVDTIYRSTGIVVKPESVDEDYYDSLDMGLKSKDVEGGSNTPKIDGRAILKEKVVMPCPRFPEGAMFTWASGTLLRSDRLRYHGNPYHSAQLMYNDESAFADSIMWDLLPIQGYLNLSLSATARWLKMISLLRRWIPESAQITPGSLDTSTGMNTEYKGKEKPEWDHIPELNESIFRLIDLSRDFIASHGYSNELAKARRAMSGNALGILQEMDDTIFRPALEQVQSMLSRASCFTLQVAADKIETPRLIKMSSMQGWQIIDGFKGEMLQGNFHAEINLMAGMPSNKVLRLEFLKSLYKDGLMTKEQVQAFLEFPSDTQALEDTQKQFEIGDARVQNLLKFPENYKETVDEEGQKLMVCQIHYHAFDNHQMMMAKLQEAMQEGFDHWNPWIQMAFLEHWNYAMEQQQKAQMQAAQMQAMAQGGGAPGEPQFPGGPEAPGTGLDGALGSSLGPSSFQDATQQPPRTQIPQPMNTGFTG